MHTKITNSSPTKCTCSQFTILLLYIYCLLNVSDLLCHHQEELNTRGKMHKILCVSAPGSAASVSIRHSNSKYIHIMNVD
jgi:hypothetical protein